MTTIAESPWRTTKEVTEYLKVARQTLNRNMPKFSYGFHYIRKSPGNIKSQIIWKTISALGSDHEKIDPITIMSKLNATEKQEITAYYLTGLSSDVATPSNVHSELPFPVNVNASIFISLLPDSADL